MTQFLNPAGRDPLAFLAGGGETGERMRSLDWSATPLGPAADWPQSLKTTVRIMLDSRYAMWMAWGPDQTFFCNDAYLPTVGVKRDWVLGSPSRKVWAEIWPDIGPRIDHVLGTGEATWDEGLLLFLERSGYPEETYHTFSYSPLYDDGGTIGGHLCVVTEVTERTLGDRRLSLLRDLASGIAATNTEAETLAAVETSLGKADRDFPFTLTYLFQSDGRAARLAAHTGLGDVPADLWPLAEVVARHGPVVVTDLTARLPALPTGGWDEPPARAVLLPIAQQGQDRPAGVFVAGLNPFRPLADYLPGVVGLCVGQLAAGLANARAYEDERKRAEALAELDRAKTTFFSNVSHEFRTPLTLMLGPLDDVLARDGSDLAPADRELLTVVHRNAQRLMKMVNSLLDFSRVEAGRVQARFEPADLAALTADLTSAFRSAVEKAGMQLTIDCPSLSEPVFVDRDLWEKVVLNLVSNAFKYTFAGEIRVTTRAGGGKAVLTVADTGTGIPAAELPKVFNRFHRIEGARGRTHEGTGIGLALVQEIVRLHGGTVRVESEVGRGSTFTVAVPFGSAHLPADRVGARRDAASTALRADTFVAEADRWLPAEPSAPVALPEKTPRPARRARVLLADDNADMREYVARLLAPAHDVIAVADGAKALDAVGRFAPDLVLTDVMMPTLDGFGLLRALRSDPATTALSVILLSARAGEEARVEGLQAGADDYLTKPFAARELIARVDAHLALTRHRREALDREKALRAEAETLNGVARGMTAELDLQKLVQKVTDAGRELTGAAFGAFFYNATTTEGESYVLYTLSGAPREAFEGFGLPRNTAVFDPTFRGEGVIRSADITKDPRYGKNLPHGGMPSGHLPLRSYLAVPVVSRSGQVHGGLFFAHPEAGVFTDRAERLVLGLAAQAGVAIDNAELFERSRREIAERTRAEEALREADRRKDEFLATLAHELRNPLAPLRNGLQIMRLPAAGPAVVEQARTMMDRQLGQMVRLIDDLLDVSRISRGKIELKPERVDLAAVIQAAVETSRPLFDAAGQLFAIDIPPSPVALWADPARLAQVFSNLLNNAAKYTDCGGRIDLAARLVGPSTVEVSVKDTGIGIPADMLPKVFDMFTQVNASLDRAQGGLGLGLNIVRRMVEKHGGDVEARSDGPGLGSEFVVRLPILTEKK